MQIVHHHPSTGVMKRVRPCLPGQFEIAAASSLVGVARGTRVSISALGFGLAVAFERASRTRLSPELRPLRRDLDLDRRGRVTSLPAGMLTGILVCRRRGIARRRANGVRARRSVSAAGSPACSVFICEVEREEATAVSTLRRGSGCLQSAPIVSGEGAHHVGWDTWSIPAGTLQISGM